MTTYRIGDITIGSDEPEFEDALARAYAQRVRPKCLCQVTGLEMYIARIGGKHFVKRMPNTGILHDSSCESYEPPAELSGLGQVLGTAIEENVDDGYTALKLGFSLSKGGTRARPTPSATEADSVKTDGSKLTLRGTLHYLWEQAGFNRWTPGMEGKRSWYVIRKFLIRAAQHKRAKGTDLAELLYVPEEWRLDKKDEIAQRRMAQFAEITGAQAVGRRLLIVVGEVKEIGQSRYGYKVLLKHVPDCAFMLNEDIHRRLLKRFAIELGLWDAYQDSHLLMIATFSVSVSGIASIEEAALMNVNTEWLPIETMYDKQLIDHLVAQRRRFVKGLRYNLPNNSPLAAAVLADTEPTATALYILPPGAESEYVTATEGLMSDSLLASWSWAAGEKALPPLPPKAEPMTPPAYLSRVPPESPVIAPRRNLAPRPSAQHAPRSAAADRPSQSEGASASASSGKRASRRIEPVLPSVPTAPEKPAAPEASQGETPPATGSEVPKADADVAAVTATQFDLREDAPAQPEQEPPPPDSSELMSAEGAEGFACETPPLPTEAEWLADYDKG